MQKYFCERFIIFQNGIMKAEINDENYYRETNDAKKVRGKLFSSSYNYVHSNVFKFCYTEYPA